LPSQILRIEDDYTAYCFDEACALIMSKIDNDEKPKFKKIKEKQKNQVKKKARMLPSEIYKKFDKQ
jgi:hypothetical protein